MLTDSKKPQAETTISKKLINRFISLWRLRIGNFHNLVNKNSLNSQEAGVDLSVNMAVLNYNIYVQEIKVVAMGLIQLF
jgi:hypothetical protein